MTFPVCKKNIILVFCEVTLVYPVWSNVHSFFKLNLEVFWADILPRSKGKNIIHTGENPLGENVQEGKRLRLAVLALFWMD